MTALGFTHDEVRPRGDLTCLRLQTEVEETGFELMPTGFGDKILDLYSAASVPAACLSSAGLRVPNLAQAWESQALPS